MSKQLLNILFLVTEFILGVILTRIVIIWMIRKDVLDHPNDRSLHKTSTPRGGGISIMILWFITVIILLVLKKIDTKFGIALLCGLPVSLIGLLDDIITISPKMRLVIQSASAVSAILIMGGLRIIDTGFTVIEAPVILSVLAVIGIVWFTNLFNFLDGMDGYLAMEVIFIGLAVYFLSGLFTPLFLASVTAGFLVWNWQPAKIFMGDVGSTLMGFSIAVFAIYYQNTGSSSIFIWLMLSSLFWFDATLTLLRRFRNKENLSSAHRKHAYQRLVQSGFSHSKTVTYAIAINIFISGFALLASEVTYLIIPLFLLLLIFLYLLVKVVDKRFPFKVN